MSIRTDEEFKSLIPPLSKEEYTQLEENCVRDGILDPLIVWPQPDGDNILIDGHNRWDISANHGGIRFDIKPIQFKDREEAKEWIIKHQLGRRNISPYVRAELALKLKPVIAEKAKENQKASGGAVPQKSAKPVDTREELAKAAGVSHDTIHKVEKIQEKAPEEVKQALRRGDPGISINKAYNDIVTVEQRKSWTPPVNPVKEAKERHSEFSTEGKTIDFEAAQQDREDRETIARETRSKIGRINLKILELAIHENGKAFEDIRLVELPEEIQNLIEETKKSISILSLIIEKLGG